MGLYYAFSRRDASFFWYPFAHGTSWDQQEREEFLGFPDPCLELFIWEVSKSTRLAKRSISKPTELPTRFGPALLAVLSQVAQIEPCAQHALVFV